MKKIFLGLIAVFACFLGRCSGPITPDPGGFAGGADHGQAQAAWAAYQNQLNLKHELMAERKAELYKIFSSDAWRTIDGATNYAGDKGWLEIQGFVTSTTPDGTFISGAWGPVLSINIKVDTYSRNVRTETSTAKYNESFKGKASNAKYSANSQTTYSEEGEAIRLKVVDCSGPDNIERKFILKNLPVSCLETDDFGNVVIREKMAFYAGTFTNNSGVIPLFDYGVPCAKIWSAAELAEIQAKKDAPKNAALEYDKKLAAKGDPYGLLRMGERSRDGDGVHKDLVMAKTYLTQAAAAGSQTAADELSQLNTTSTDSATQ